MDATAMRQAAMRELRKLTGHPEQSAAAVGEAAAAGTPLVIDIAWARPTVAQIAAVGNIVGVIRYFSNDSTKNLRRQEVQDYLAKGWGVGAVWETSTGRARAGYAAGQQDARTADAQRVGCGLPDNFVIKFAVDEDTTWASVQPYFQGVVSELGKDRVGVYGGFSVIEGAHAWGLRDLWQTLAWSAGKVSAHATLYQYGAYALNRSADLNHVLAADWGQHPRPEADVPLTQADADLVARTLTGPGNRDALAAAVVYWLQKATDPTAAIDTAAWPGAQASQYRAVLQKAIKAEQAADAALAAATQKAILTEVEAKLAAFEQALPTMLQQALAAALVHVDVTVNGKTGA